MLNFNGKLLENDQKFIESNNRGLQYGDAVFEELRVVHDHVHFLEEHYLRLMSSMRILRMQIPMEFTMEFVEDQILNTCSEQGASGSYQVKFLVFRDSTGDVLPVSNKISYMITVHNLGSPFFIIEDKNYEVELFKDFYKNSNMLSTLSTNNCILNVVVSIYANENDYQDCLLLNQDKSVLESLRGNLFLVKGNSIKTPPLSDGCLSGILRKKLLDIILKIDSYEIKEESISPFELQKADELFLVDSINGITPITKYRKKIFKVTTAKDLVGKLNAFSRLNSTKESI